MLLLSRRSPSLTLTRDNSIDFFSRHAHIYGIDLASPSELLAHERKAEVIAKHIGADKVIFQDLEDLESACAEAVSSGMTIRENQKFEVGVFSGNYVTPVDTGYFAHLEKIRGETRKMKIMEHAREAVANGSAGQEEFDIATNGIKVEGEGDIVPESSHDPSHDPGASSAINGNHGEQKAQGKRKREGGEETPSPRDRMDISLHNFGDYTG